MINWSIAVNFLSSLSLNWSLFARPPTRILWARQKNQKIGFFLCKMATNYSSIQWPHRNGRRRWLSEFLIEPQTPFFSLKKLSSFHQLGGLSCSNASFFELNLLRVKTTILSERTWNLFCQLPSLKTSTAWILKKQEAISVSLNHSLN